MLLKHPKRSSACLPIDLILQVLQEVRVGVQGGDGTLHGRRHRGRRLEAGAEHHGPLKLVDGHLTRVGTQQQQQQQQ